ncbi:MAG: cupin domain-containing protein [Thermomicrobiales bacterium]|nr:cupin domain-containing protein [Thermomicrobiales bacterium]
MSYKASPRPTFDHPAPIPYASVTRHLWGDDASGEVADWIYVSSGKIHQLVFGLAPGGVFRHSDGYRTVFAADEIYYVLSGTMAISNPETGEVHRVAAGEAAFFRRDTWHHAWSIGSDALRVLEFFAPPPSQGTSGAYARTRPNLVDVRYTRDEWLGRWPMDQAEARRSNTIQVVRDADLLWRMEGAERPVLVGLLAATEHLTVGKVRLLPGQHTEPQCHGGDESIYVLEGTLNVRLRDAEGPSWFELAPRDGCFLPEGTTHQYYNVTDQPVELIFGVAPHYLGGGASS